MPLAGSAPRPWPPVARAAAAFLAVALILALARPDLLWPAYAAAALAGVGFLVLRHPIPASAAWLAFTGTTPEMWLGDLTGGDATIIALTKLTGIALVGVCMLRYGARADPANPAFAFAAIFICGLLHGLHPNLTAAESLRTLAGSAAPYAFAFARLPRRWASTIIRTTCWLPLLSVLLCIPLSLADIRPLFRELDGLRLAGLGHPAFLGGIALTGIYACLVELFRGGRRQDLALLAANAAILLLSGARAPLIAAAAVGAAAFLLLRSPAFPWRRRIPVILAIGAALPPIFVLASRFTAFRLFNLWDNSIDDLSGRDLIWPYFQDAWDASPGSAGASAPARNSSTPTPPSPSSSAPPPPTTNTSASASTAAGSASPSSPPAWRSGASATPPACAAPTRSSSAWSSSPSPSTPSPTTP